MYKSEIYQMNETELYDLAAKHTLVVEFYDADELIDILEHQDGTIFECTEDDILDSIMNGNWTDAALQMLDNNITPHALVDYVNDYRFEQYDEAYEFFDLDSAVTITELYYQQRQEAA